MTENQFVSYEETLARKVKCISFKTNWKRKTQKRIRWRNKKKRPRSYQNQKTGEIIHPYETNDIQLISLVYIYFCFFFFIRKNVKTQLLSLSTGWKAAEIIKENYIISKCRAELFLRPGCWIVKPLMNDHCFNIFPM